MWTDLGLILLFLLQAALALLTVCAACSWMLSCFLNDSEKSWRRFDESISQCSEERSNKCLQQKLKRKLDNKNDYDVLIQKRLKHSNKAAVEEQNVTGSFSGLAARSVIQKQCGSNSDCVRATPPDDANAGGMEKHERPQRGNAKETLLPRMSSADTSKVLKEEAGEQLQESQPPALLCPSIDSATCEKVIPSSLVCRAENLRASVGLTTRQYSVELNSNAESVSDDFTSSRLPSTRVLPSSINTVKHEKTQPASATLFDNLVKEKSLKASSLHESADATTETSMWQLARIRCPNTLSSVDRHAARESISAITTNDVGRLEALEMTTSSAPIITIPRSIQSSTSAFPMHLPMSLAREAKLQPTSALSLKVTSTGKSYKRKSSTTAITLQLLSISHGEEERYKLSQFCRPLLKTVNVDQCISGLSNFLVNKMSSKSLNFNGVIQSIQKIQELLALEISDYLEVYLIFEGLDVRITERFPLEAWLIAAFANVKGDFKEEQVLKCIKEFELDLKTLKAVAGCLLSVKKGAPIEPCDLQRALAALTEVVLRRSMRIRSSKSAQKTESKQATKEKKNEILGSCWAPRLGIEMDEAAVTLSKRESLEKKSWERPTQQSSTVTTFCSFQSKNLGNSAFSNGDSSCTSMAALKEETEENSERSSKPPKRLRIKTEQ